MDPNSNIISKYYTCFTGAVLIYFTLHVVLKNYCYLYALWTTEMLLWISLAFPAASGTHGPMYNTG